MTKRRTGLLVLGACLLASAFGAGYGLSVLAQGAPTTQPLFYSGVLEVDGAPASGVYTVKIELYDAATKGHSLCDVKADVDVEDGHFRIDASDCADALAAEPDAWVATSFVDSADEEHAIPQRSKVGAVPYALEAQHAVSASKPSGTLANTIDDLTGRVRALEVGSAQSSAFLVFKNSAQTTPAGEATTVLFDEVAVDVGDEYDPAEGKFTANADGLYEFSCTIAWAIGAGMPGTWEVALALNGFEFTYSGMYTDSESVTRTLTGVMALEKGDGVTCSALAGATADLNIGHYAYNTFTGHRLR